MSSNELKGRAQSILDFASHLELVLSTETNLAAQSFPDCSTYFAALPLPRKELSPNQRIEFDRRGVALWNKCCNIGRGDENQHALGNVAQVRAFSYLLLESSASIKRKNQPRLFKQALKASKSCVDAGLLEVASKILEYLAPKDENLSEAPDQDDNNGGKAAQNLKAQYLLLRIASAWKQDNLTVVEHFHAQLEKIIPTLRLDRIGELIDLCYEIGTDQFNKKQASLAIRWLRRGCQLLEEHSNQIADVDIIELKLPLMHTLVRALLLCDDSENGLHAFQAFEALRAEFPHKLSVILLQLEQYGKDKDADVEAYRTELMKAVRSVSINPSNHKLIVHYVHHLKTLSTSNAIHVLDAYIVTRLAPNDEIWTESTVITLIWLMTSSDKDDGQLELSDYAKLFDNIHQAWRKELGAEATHGALVLFWKRIEYNIHHDLKERTIEWCQLALHQIFSNAGDHNVGKLERKIVKCFIDLRNHAAAQEAFEMMSPARKQHPLSRYLRYSLCLRLGNEDGRSALASLASIHDDRNRFLFAAVSEALQHGSKIGLAHLLQRILDKYNDNLPPGIDAFTILRFTAQLLIPAVPKTVGEDEELLIRLCGIYKSAVRLTQKQQNSQMYTSETRLRECKWFEKTSYNAAVEHLRSWSAKHLIDFLHYSSEIRYPADAPQDAQHNKVIHEINVKYMEAILYTVQARSATASCTAENLPTSAFAGKSPPSSPAEIRSTLYQNVLARYTEVNSLLITLRGAAGSNQNSEEIGETVTQKMIVLAPLAFEALLFLPSSCPSEKGPHMINELSLFQIIDQTMALNPTHKTYSVFADMILSASTHCANHADHDMFGHPQLAITTTVNLLARLVNCLRSQPIYDSSQAAKWIRCMIQVVLDRLEAGGSDTRDPSGDSSGTSGTAEVHDKKNLSTLAMLTEHALVFVRSNGAYPAEELQWLATTLFNLAINMYMSPSSSAPTGPRAASDTVTATITDRGTNGGENPTTPQFWAKRAVAFADVLALGASTNSNGTGPRLDDGILARTLRERCERFKWDV